MWRWLLTCRVPGIKLIQRDAVLVGDGPAAVTVHGLVVLRAVGGHAGLRRGDGTRGRRGGGRGRRRRLCRSGRRGPAGGGSADADAHRARVAGVEARVDLGVALRRVADPWVIGYERGERDATVFGDVAAEPSWGKVVSGGIQEVRTRVQEKAYLQHPARRHE